MLFQKFYNYIKYKTLPPSLLFKNRLFIERNSQKYRILTNLGLTFRSSKWSVFAKNNLKFNFKINFLKILFLFVSCSIGIFLFTHTSNIQFFNFFNNFCFLFWVNVDLIDYYISFLIWFLYFFFIFTINRLYSYFFFNNFFNTAPTFYHDAALYNEKLIYTTNSKNVDGSLLAKNSALGWNLNLWLDRSTLTNQRERVITSLFDAQNIGEAFGANIANLSNFFKILYFTNFVDQNKFSMKSLIAGLIEKKNYQRAPLSPNLPNSLELLKYELFFANTNTQQSGKFENLFYSNYFQNFTNSQWSENVFVARNFIKSSFLVHDKVGFFFFDNLAHEFFNLNTTANLFLTHIGDDFVNFGKLNKWLYKYSLLNRKLLKNSFKMTTMKQSLQMGTLGNNFFTKNLWNTYFFSTNADFRALLDTMGSLTSIVASTQSEISVNTINNNIFKNFSSLETSYFWLLKRFFFFSNLSTNRFFSNFQKKSSMPVNILNNNESRLNHLNIFFFLKQLNFQTLSLPSPKPSSYPVRSVNAQYITTSLRDVSLFLNNDECLSQSFLQKLYILLNFEICKNAFNFNKFLILNSVANTSLHLNSFYSENTNASNNGEFANLFSTHFVNTHFFIYRNDLFFFADGKWDL